MLTDDCTVVSTDHNFESLDMNFDPAIDVARGEYGTLYIQTNSPAGRMCSRIWMHPYMAAKLRDWLNANYEREASEYLSVD